MRFKGGIVHKKESGYPPTWCRWARSGVRVGYARLLSFRIFSSRSSISYQPRKKTRIPAAMAMRKLNTAETATCATDLYCARAVKTSRTSRTPAAHLPALAITLCIGALRSVEGARDERIARKLTIALKGVLVNAQ